MSLPPLLFWREFDAETGWLSNWSAHPITEPSGERHATAEHAYMTTKARWVCDETAIAMIAASPSPREAKRIARAVAMTPEDVEGWDRIKFGVMVEIVRAKTEQHPTIKDALLASSGRTIAEASPYDLVWGIGIDAKRAAGIPPSNWPGQNLLGKAWTRVREEMLAAAGESESDSGNVV